jgi:hypothetical protein
VLEILGLVGLAVAILWLGRIFYILQKGLNEIITGLTSIDERLTRVEAQLAAQHAHDPEPEA